MSERSAPEDGSSAHSTARHRDLSGGCLPPLPYLWQVHCPNSNFTLSSGVCNVREWLEEGHKVGLGTDVAGGYSPSILNAIRLARGTSHALPSPSHGLYGLPQLMLYIAPPMLATAVASYTRSQACDTQAQLSLSQSTDSRCVATLSICVCVCVCVCVAVASVATYTKVGGA